MEQSGASIKKRVSQGGDQSPLEVVIEPWDKMPKDLESLDKVFSSLLSFYKVKVDVNIPLSPTFPVHKLHH